MQRIQLMKVLSLVVGTMLAMARADMIPTQTYFIPMPEKDVFDYTFKQISSSAKGPVTSMVALAISTEGTVVIYDHQEDGFEPSYADASKFKSTTQVWGDGDCSNGYAPGTSCTFDSQDKLVSGQSIVIQDSVDMSGSGTTFGGGDKVLATYPIAITRGEYPADPGSLMAGAVEVLATSEWGTSFVAPVGQNLKDQITRGFEHVAFYVMAAQDGTVLNFSDGTKKTINSGQSYTHTIDNMGETLTASAPVQVDLVTGDKGSSYELRWFSLLPRDQWTNDYFSPVGDSKGDLKIFLYNPNSSSIYVSVETRFGTYSKKVYGKSWTTTNEIPTGTGASLTSTSDFIALSLTDTSSSTSGQIYDWGFPVMPRARLTTEVLIGWGYGCTSQNCKGGDVRSVVWVSPVEKADIYIDTNNDGTPESRLTEKGVQRLESIIFKDGTDLSGAVIWAVKPGQHYTSTDSVEIAAAWGQNAAYSYSGDSQALDLGTLVPPFNTIRVDEAVKLITDKDGDGLISPGDIVEYTIQVQNAGQKDYTACDYKIKYPGKAINLPRQSRVDNTCKFSDGSTTKTCDDDALVSDSGICAPTTLKKRGGVHTFKFQAEVGSPSELDVVDISNNGILTQDGLGPQLPFSVPEVVHFNPSINIEKTVHMGKLSTCSNGAELQSGPEDSDVTYCFEVTNTGNSYLKNVVVTDPDNGMSAITSIPQMAPGEVKFVKFQTKIGDKPVNTDAKVKADPVLFNGKDIPTYSGGSVEDTDDAGVQPIPPVNPNVGIEKTVHLGTLNTCSNGAEEKSGPEGYTVTYCFEVTNKGDTYLDDVVVTDPENGMSPIKSIPRMAPGAVVFVEYKTTIPSSDKNTFAKVEAKPVQQDGSDLPYYSGGDVSDTDNAGVKPIPPSTPNVDIEKTVHLGTVSSCSNGDEIQVAPKGTTVTYCFQVVNSGDTYLKDVVVTDPENGMSPITSIPTLAPGDVKFVGYTTQIPASPIKTDAKVEATPSQQDGSAIPFYTGGNVSDKDPAGVEPLAPSQPDVSIEKTIHKGSLVTCSNGKELETGYQGDAITYCFEVENTGDTYLKNVVVTDPDNGMTEPIKIPFLAPDEVVFVKYETTIPTSKTVTSATVTGDPVKSDGSQIPYYEGGPVEDSDSAGVDPLPLSTPSVNIEKTVHLGDLSTCFNGAEMQYGYSGTTVTYCYEVTNTGDIDLNVQVTDGPVDFTSPKFVLTPGESTFVKKVSKITEDLTSPGVATGKPADNQGPVTDSDPAGVAVVPVQICA